MEPSTNPEEINCDSEPSILPLLHELLLTIPAVEQASSDILTNPDSQIAEHIEVNEQNPLSGLEGELLYLNSLDSVLPFFHELLGEIPSAEYTYQAINVSESPETDQPHSSSEVLRSTLQSGGGGVQRPVQDEADRPRAGGSAESIQDEIDPCAGTSADSSQRQTRMVEGEHFNNLEMRRSFEVPSRDSSDLFRFYQDVVGILHQMSEEIGQEVRRGDLIQLELRGEQFHNHITLHMNDDNDIDAILPAFEGLLERIVQSNQNFAADEKLDLIAQIVHNPTGGYSRVRTERLLDCELIAKKRRHLYIVGERDDQLCFAISLAHVMRPGSTDAEAACEGERLQGLAGLSRDTAVNFSDICKFESIVKRKIIIFHRKREGRALSRFETGFTDRTHPVFLFLFHEHYYGVQNIVGFLGSKYVCRYCYAPYEDQNKHRCEGWCQVCKSYSCTDLPYKPVLCQSCNRWCRTALCYEKHKEIRQLPSSLGKRKRNPVTRSVCDAMRRCNLCLSVYGVDQKHTCRGQKCPICGVQLPFQADLDGHKCYMLPLQPSEEHTGRIVFFVLKP